MSQALSSNRPVAVPSLTAFYARASLLALRLPWAEFEKDTRKVTCSLIKADVRPGG
jgi:hypothetical protein